MPPTIPSHPHTPSLKHKLSNLSEKTVFSETAQEKARFFYHPSESKDSVDLKSLPASGLAQTPQSPPIPTYSEAIQSLPSGHKMKPFGKDHWHIPSQLTKRASYKKGRRYGTNEIYLDNQEQAHRVFGQWQNLIDRLRRDSRQRKNVNVEIAHAEKEWRLPSTQVRLRALEEIKKLSDKTKPSDLSAKAAQKAEIAIIDSQFSLLNPFIGMNDRIQKTHLDRAERKMSGLENTHFHFSDIYNSDISHARKTLSKKLDKTLDDAKRLAQSHLPRHSGSKGKKVPAKQAEKELANAYSILRTREIGKDGYTGWGEGLNPCNSSLAKNSSRSKRTSLPKTKTSKQSKKTAD